jgi:hypothetical protein
MNFSQNVLSTFIGVLLGFPSVATTFLNPAWRMGFGLYWELNIDSRRDPGATFFMIFFMPDSGAVRLISGTFRASNDIGATSQQFEAVLDSV